jgi:PPOX class probable F420-dependent enzyme
MPGNTTIDDVRAYLERPRCAVISTVAADGAPHQAVVHYFVGADHLIVNGSSHRLWVEHLKRDRRVSLIVHDADRPLHWVGVKGEATVLAEDEAAVKDAMALARRYGEEPADFAGLERISFVIRPRRVFEYG